MPDKFLALILRPFSPLGCDLHGADPPDQRTKQISSPQHLLANPFRGMALPVSLLFAFLQRNVSTLNLFSIGFDRLDNHPSKAYAALSHA